MFFSLFAAECALEEIPDQRGEASLSEWGNSMPSIHNSVGDYVETNAVRIGLFDIALRSGLLIGNLLTSID